jgi:HK97 family phage prohead protease
MRASRTGERRLLTGHAAVFDVASHPIADFRERIAPGAFSEAIKSDDVRALWNHDRASVLARTKSGTLRLREDRFGLAFEMDVAETQAGDDALVSIRRGDVDEMSFGFITIKDEWVQEAGQPAVRILKKVRLLDVSPVSFPAYPNTDVAVRSRDAWKNRQGRPSKAWLVRELELAEAEMELGI